MMGQLYGERWEVVKSLGEGGQAHTFLVIDREVAGETQYALKRLKNTHRIERFRREIEAVSDLSHENIVRLIAFDLDSESPYLVTDYCAGGSLDKAEPFWHGSPGRAIEVFQQVCAGVAHAHAHEPPIIHRDLKPANVFLRTREGPAVVGDFGICYLEEDGRRITLTQEAVGPRIFIAPELEEGRVSNVSKSSDVYSLGKLLYWLLSKGKLLSREKHRDRERDLKGWDRTRRTWDNVYMEHVNRLLDNMIVEDPDQRYPVHQVLLIAEDVARLVEKEFNPVDPEIPQPCYYCGQGYYRLQVANTTQVDNFGLRAVGASDWRILVCDSCGNVQFFRMEMAGRKEWWGDEMDWR